jgi:hypothetical protein
MVPSYSKQNLIDAPCIALVHLLKAHILVFKPKLERYYDEVLAAARNKQSSNSLNSVDNYID